jgi:hypothetical protein
MRDQKPEPRSGYAYRIPAITAILLLAGTSRRTLALQAAERMEASLQHQAITEIQTKRPDLFGFEVNGKIMEHDIEWMARRLKGAFDAHGTVDIIIVMRNWEGIALSAVFDSEGLSAQGKAVQHVRKYAVVGAPTWAEAMINLMAPISPVEAKTFDLEDEKAAWQWVENPEGSA